MTLKDISIDSADNVTDDSNPDPKHSDRKRYHPRQKRRKVTEHEESSQPLDEESASSPSPAPSESEDCGCVDVNKHALSRIDRISKTEGGLNTDLGCVEVLGILLKRNKGSLTLSHVCYRHLVKLGGKCGLRVNTLKKPILESRLRAVFNSRADLDSLKIDPKSYEWFRLKDRPKVAQDELGVYRFPVRRPTLLKTLNEDQARLLVDEIAGPGSWSLWERDGNLIIDDLFRWAFDGFEHAGMLVFTTKVLLPLLSQNLICTCTTKLAAMVGIMKVG